MPFSTTHPEHVREIMNSSRVKEATILGILLCVGLIYAGYQISSTAIQIKAMDRIVTVKGLAEREVMANIAIWPITFNEAHNDLAQLYSQIESKTDIIIDFLKENGFPENEITISQPSIIDKQAQNYGDANAIKFRFTAQTTITVYSSSVDKVRGTMKKLVELGKNGIAISGQDYGNKTEFLFTKLNEIKPEMIEEATNNAREVALKFASDSKSKLGKIKQATQGQFSINDRDSSTKHIKKIRVVSTVQYYLSD